MKISIIADCHLNKALYKGIMDKLQPFIPFRNADFMRAFEYMVDENINKIKPDLVVVAGDIYDTFDPSNAVRGFFNSQLQRLSAANIPVILMVGNHDICRKHHALKPIQELNLKSIKVVENPKMIEFKGTLLMIFPYSLDVEQNKITIKKQFHDFVADCKVKIENKGMQDKEVLFFGHFGVKGASISEYETKNAVAKIANKTKRSFINDNGKDISLEDLDSIGAKYAFLGDYHKHQILATKSVKAMYTGSIEKSDMSEIDQKKGFVVYDSEMAESPRMGTCKFIEYPNCRPMIELKGTLLEMHEQLNALDTSDKKYDAAIVKIAFVGDSVQLSSFAEGLEGLKREIKQEANPVHMFHTQKVANIEESEEASSIEQEIMDRGNLTNDDVLDVVSAMICERESDEDEQKVLLALAEDIYKTTMEGE